MKFPDRIRRLQAALGLNQRRLAMRLGVTTETVNRWLNGHCNPGSDITWMAIASLEGEAGIGGDKPTQYQFTEEPESKVAEE